MDLLNGDNVVFNFILCLILVSHPGLLNGGLSIRENHNFISDLMVDQGKTENHYHWSEGQTMRICHNQS